MTANLIDSKASSSHYEKPRSLANTDVKNKDYLINGEQRQQDSTRNNFSRAKHSERQIKQDKQYNQIQRGQAKKQEQNTSNNQMQNFNHHISKDQNTYTEPKEVVVVDGWGEPVEKSLDHLQPKLSVQNKNKSIDRHAYDEWGIPLNPEVTLEKLPSHKVSFNILLIRYRR